MPWWYYKGRVTTPVDIPGNGPTIIKPRMVFQAPLSSVVHLKRIGMVVPSKPPKGFVEKTVEVEKEPPQLKKEEPEPEAIKNRDALGLSAVVASGPSEPEAWVEVIVKEQEVGVETVEMQEQEQKQEQEEEKQKYGRKKHR